MTDIGSIVPLPSGGSTPIGVVLQARPLGANNLLALAVRPLAGDTGGGLTVGGESAPNPTPVAPQAVSTVRPQPPELRPVFESRPDSAPTGGRALAELTGLDIEGEPLGLAPERAELPDLPGVSDPDADASAEPDRASEGPREPLPLFGAANDANAPAPQGVGATPEQAVSAFSAAQQLGAEPPARSFDLVA